MKKVEFYISFDGNMNCSILFFYDNKQYTFEDEEYNCFEEVSQSTKVYEVNSLDDAKNIALRLLNS